MKRVILLLAMLTGLSGAVPMIWGPAGMPDVWDFITDITGLDSLNVNHLVVNTTADLGPSITSDSSSIVDFGADTVLIGSGATGADIDVGFGFRSGEDTEYLRYDDGTNLFTLSVGVAMLGNAQLNNLLDFYSTTATIDPENSGRGTLSFGTIGDADIIDLQGEWHLSSDAVATYDTTSTVANGVHLVLLNTGAGQDTLNLPAAASHSGRVLIIKAINANGGHVDGNGAETIDGSAVQDLAQWDSITIYCNGTTWYIL